MPPVSESRPLHRKLTKKNSEMKANRKILALTGTAIIFAISCGNAYKIDIPHYDYGTDEEEEISLPVTPDPDAPKVPTLNDPTGKWQTEKLENGLVLYTFRGYDDVTEANQIVNVLEVNLSDPRYSIKFAYADKGEINSNMVKNEPAAIAGINGGYEQEAIYIKINNAIISQVSLQPGHLRYWKHEACIFSEGERTVGILYGGKDGEKAIEAYDRLEAENIIASAPMLINDYEPIGEDFVGGTFTEDQLMQFDYEDYRRHQGVRHPRTVYALTEDNDLLLIAIDGRWSGTAEGMNAAEVTRFISRYFNPQWAINMDGGGSTTLTVKGLGHPETNVVNYPTDGGTHDHTGERSVSTHILVLYDEDAQ